VQIGFATPVIAHECTPAKIAHLKKVRGTDLEVVAVTPIRTHRELSRGAELGCSSSPCALPAFDEAAPLANSPQPRQFSAQVEVVARN